MAREHDREHDKERQLRRWQQAQRHLIPRDEELRRKQAAKARRASARQAPREREWRDDDDLESIAKMRPRAANATPAPRDAPAGLPRALVTAVHSNGLELDGRPARLAAELLLLPSQRPVVGDEVEYVETDGPPRAVAVLPRRSCIARPDPGNAHRLLVLAANADVGVIVVATSHPPLRPGLIDRCLVALARGGVSPLVCVNKIDLLDAAGMRVLAAQMAPYVELAIPVLLCSTVTSAGIDDLRIRLQRRTAVFLGHSGVGKSSLLNALDPAGARRVGDVREHDGKGRHTTTAASMRRFGDGLCVIDTPGMRAFGLASPSPEELRDAFPEFLPFARRCRFGDCTHSHEPQCGVRDAVEDGGLATARYASYRRILAADD